MSQHLMGAKETLDVCGRLREGFCADIQTVMSSVEDSKVSSEWNDAPVYMELVRHVHTFVTYAGQVPDGPDHSREIFQVRAQAFEQAYVNVIRGNMVSNAKKHPILQEMIEKAAIDLQQKMEELEDNYAALKSSGQAITTKMEREYESRRSDLSRKLEKSNAVEVTPELIEKFTSNVLEQTASMAQQLLSIMGLEPEVSHRRSPKA